MPKFNTTLTFTGEATRRFAGQRVPYLSENFNATDMDHAHLIVKAMAKNFAEIHLHPIGSVDASSVYWTIAKLED